MEPFAGGLAVALALKPTKAILGDANPHLINFYQQLVRGLVIDSIPLRNDEETYYRNRETFNSLIKRGLADTKKAAALFYYLNRTGYNGLCRFNASGLFNVPFGRYRKINYTRDFTPYQAAFRGWRFACRDFACGRPHPEAFIYADPPYDVQFTEYASGGFGWDDQVRLARWLAKHPGPVVASNQATERILRLYEELGFTIKLLDAPRMISCTGDRAPAKEMLAMKGI